ncbi:MAG: bifunctional folylpolyglutamate synthase/dihydrofolate synthase [Proteobacteria bacterium]|nr:bifunctional folylpolyglutamate synthase/dihydrofolate synthase [Pseudomonadota bacterium]
MSSWTYSPVPAVEESIQKIRLKYPADYPAGLGRVQAILEKLGNPHQKLPHVFHVAGTNGKGSTLAFLQSIYEAAGLSVHKYISPHLVRFEERIILNGKMIEADKLLDLINECEEAARTCPVSFFELITVAAFLAYARYPADVLLLETGLGGLYDATNVIDGKQLISLLTRISYDHTHILGTTLAEIAVNKAGIIKPGCPCIVAPQMAPEVMEVFRRRATAVAAPIFACGQEWMVSADDNHFEYKSATNTFRLPLPNLVGRHQIDNAGTALAAIEHSPYAPLLQQHHLELAMHRVNWPGRLQRLASGRLAELLPSGWELWLDGAHNDSGAEILVDQIKAWGKSLPLHLITAMKKTKDAAEFYRPLLPHVATVQTVDVNWIEAPMTSAEALCDQVRQLGCQRTTITPNLESALRSLTFQFSSPQRILITGSLYLVGHALKEK